MVKRKKHLLACAALAMMVALSACSSAADQPKDESEKVNSEAASGTAEPAVTEGTSEPATATGTDTEAASTPAGSESANQGETSAVEGLPEYLPKDFPLPDDAKITTASSGENEGKKSAMLIFTTEQDMETVSKLYKDYFATKKLTDSGQMIDEKNIVIQGTEPDMGNQWSLIGGTMASKEGVIELTLTWAES